MIKELKVGPEDPHYVGTDLTMEAAEKAARPWCPCTHAYVSGFLEARSRYRQIEDNMREWIKIKDKALKVLHEMYNREKR